MANLLRPICYQSAVCSSLIHLICAGRKGQGAQLVQVSVATLSSALMIDAPGVFRKKRPFVLDHESALACAGGGGQAPVVGLCSIINLLMIDPAAV